MVVAAAFNGTLNSRPRHFEKIVFLVGIEETRLVSNLGNAMPDLFVTL